MIRSVFGESILLILIEMQLFPGLVTTQPQQNVEIMGGTYCLYYANRSIFAGLYCFFLAIRVFSGVWSAYKHYAEMSGDIYSLPEVPWVGMRFA